MMADQELAGKLLDEVANVFGASADELTSGTRLLEDLKIDSMHRMILANILSEELGREIGYSEINACETVGDLLELGAADKD